MRGFEGVVVSTPIEEGSVEFDTKPVQVTLQTGVELPFDKGPALVVPKPSSKISVLLQERIENAKPDEREEIVVHLRDPLELKQMPRFGPEDRGTKEFEAVQIQRKSYIAELQADRDRQAAELINRLSGRSALRAIHVPWLSSTPIVDMRLADVEGLAKSDDVISVSLNEGELELFDVLGHHSDPNDDILDVRQAMRTDPYDNLGNNWGYIGVIDSESPREKWRLQTLRDMRGLEHETDNEVPRGDPRTDSSPGAGACRGVPVAMGGDQVHRSKVWHDIGDAAQVGETG